MTYQDRVKNGFANTWNDFDHPRRCNGTRNGRRCKYWAKKGEAYCPFHLSHGKGKETERTIITKTFGIIAKYDKDFLKTMSFYSSRVGPKLKAFLNDALNKPRAQQLDLTEELALIRSIAGEAASLYSAAIELDPNTKGRNDLIMQSASMMQTALAEVVKTCKTAAEVDAMSKDKFSAAALNDVVAQITRFVYESFNDHPESLSKFDYLLTEHLRLPKLGVEGTLLTPDEDVIEMDNTIPVFVESENENVSNN